MSDAFWISQLQKHDAIEVKHCASINQRRRGSANVPHIRDAPADRAIWYETGNFGWIFSPKGKNGVRKILLKY